ncbi:MAG: hypothetical protein MJA30_11870 [Cytophagales bacterium]|nr:hypothetical protein [Cytophagales bacterium]
MQRKAQYITWGTSAVVLIAAITFYFFQGRENSNREKVPEPPPVNYWEMFAGISLERKFVEEADAYYRIPVFTPILLDHTGKEVTLSGYYLPYSELDSVIIISRFPNASCFFCGRAGIESVAMVELDRINRTSYYMDQRLTVRGKLVLNSTDIKKLAFVITDAFVEEL